MTPTTTTTTTGDRLQQLPAKMRAKLIDLTPEEHAGLAEESNWQLFHRLAWRIHRRPTLLPLVAWLLDMAELSTEGRLLPEEVAVFIVACHDEGFSAPKCRQLEGQLGRWVCEVCLRRQGLI